jgi:ribosomal protein S18 acetylase RimI-like enzyme
MSEPSVAKAVPQDVAVLAGVLVRAFEGDPFVRWLTRPDARRLAGMRRFFELALRHVTLPHDEVYTTADHAGAALWTPPGRWQLGLLEELRHLSDFAAACGVTRLLDVFRGTNAVLRRHPTTPHWYLFVLGVDPPHQGRGLGRALVAPILARCDRERTAAYLETANERSLGFYRALGFETHDEIVVPCGGPRTWLLWRDPR